MSRLILIFFAVVSINILSDEKEDKKTENFDYTSFEISFVQTDSTGIGARLSIPLPGGLYIVAERKAEEIDSDSGSYERIINSARIGVHAGIGDLFSSISSRGIKLNVKNIFDVYAELGIKGTAYETDINSFSKTDSKANAIAGIRFGDPSGWEAKLFVDLSKDAEVVQVQCPDNQVCTQVVQYQLSEDTDQKFGAGVMYNINTRSAFTVDMTSSKLFDTALKVGYRFNF